jgi:hypothetical protein
MAIVWPRSSTARSAQNLEVAQRFGNFVYYTFVTNLSLTFRCGIFIIQTTGTRDLAMNLVEGSFVQLSC